MNPDTPITLTFDEWERAKRLADARMKYSNGHRFLILLKTRCQYCGRSPRAKGRCRAWFQTYLSQLDTILLNLDAERRDGSRRAEEPSL